MLRENPGFTLVVVLTLALGIGANTAIFSVVNAVLLKSLPYPEPGRLVQLCMDMPSGERRTVLGSSGFVALRTQSDSFTHLAAYAGGDTTLRGSEQADRVLCAGVTADFFPLLGIQPTLGRNFAAEEDAPGGPRAAILGYALWQSRFGGDRGILGRPIILGEQSCTVVGVLGPTFHFPQPFQVWTPLSLGPSGSGGQRLLQAIGRLKPGVTLSQAQAELRTIAQREQSPRPDQAPVVSLVPLHEYIAGNVKRALLVLLGAVGFVLLIACANVANLLLARAATRQKEMAVRAALGAGRRRVVRQLLTESVLLAIAGGGLGLLFAFWGADALGRLTAALPTLHGIRIDTWVLAFTLGLSLLAGLAFGLAPAFQVSRTDVNVALKEGSPSGTGGHRQHLRHLLVVSQMALALVLLIGGGLLVRSFSRLREVQPGFRAEGVLTLQMTLMGENSRKGPPRANFIAQVIERLNALPGVQAAAATDALPLTHFAKNTAAFVEGRPVPPPEQWTEVSLTTVTLDYFKVMGIVLREGRAFTPQDAQGGTGVVIINEAFEKHCFPGESAIGKRLSMNSPSEGPWLTVVGVVGNIRQRGLESDVTLEAYHPEIEKAGGAMSFVIRTTGAPTSLASAARAAVAQVDRNQPVHNVMSMEERLSNTMTPRRLNLVLLGSFGAVALILATVGIYAVISYAVTQRTREIGLRMALGAQRHDVLRIVVQHGMTLTFLGVVIGLAGSFALTRVLSSLLYEVSPTDPATLIAVTVLLISVSLLACWLPACRAARIDPMVALRHE